MLRASKDTEIQTKPLVCSLFPLFQKINLICPLFLCLQDLSCIDDLSTNSLFSSPADSLSEYADQSFISTDNLDTVPTLWDVNTSTTTTPAQSQLEVSSKPSSTHVSIPEAPLQQLILHLLCKTNLFHMHVWLGGHEHQQAAGAGAALAHCHISLSGGTFRVLLGLWSILFQHRHQCNLYSENYCFLFNQSIKIYCTVSFIQVNSKCLTHD